MNKDLICYCFGFSEEDIVSDVRENKGTSLILQRILHEKKQGVCNCTVNHPLGR